MNEQALRFDCEGDSLVGVLSAPPSAGSRGVLIVVGGPQYRAGSHRQFTLLARQLAQARIASLRFDYRGMGDSSGTHRTFEHIDADIRCALDQLFAAVPGLTDAVIWGLCDAASAALLYAHRDARVSGLALVNPWVRTEQGMARTQLRHYYAGRLFQANLWRKMVSGELHLGRALAGLWQSFSAAARRERPALGREASLPQRMEDGLRRFRGRILLILSGNDLTAQEFRDLVAASAGWKSLLADRRVSRHAIAEATHTFSRREWRDEVARWTVAWIKETDRA